MQAKTKKYARDFSSPQPKAVTLKVAPAFDNQNDHFATDESGNRYAGRHLILDVTQASSAALSDAEKIRAMMTVAAEESGATLLGIDLHHFTGGGVSGVAILAESHISIHTWPEHGFAAVDVFMCGSTQPSKCIAIIKEYLSAKSVQVTEVKRGYMVDAAEAV